MTGDSGSHRNSISRPEEEVIVQYIKETKSPIHVFGEPGVGKTTLLQRIDNEHSDEIRMDRRNIRANHHLNDLFREICHSLYDALPDEKKEEGRKLVGGSLSTPVGGAGISFETQAAEASRAQFEYRDSLIGLSELFPEESTLVVCVDDIHELSDNERAVRGAISEAVETLPSNVVLITAGRLTWHDLDTSISLDMFTEDQTFRFLQTVFTDVSVDRMRRIHDQLGGHPLYIGLLAESNVEEDLPNIPTDEVQNKIEERYFDFLEPDERRLLLATAPLDELNEELCTRVVSNEYDFDRVDVADILDSLSTRTVVQTIGRNTDGLKTFKVHDVFREFLEDRSSHLEVAEQGACVYYAEKLIQLVKEDRTLETEVDYVTSWSSHLSDAVIHEESQVLSELIEDTVADDGLRFYSLSLLVREFKRRDASELPDPIVDSLLTSVDQSCSMANTFYDEELDQSWAELLFENGAFTDPDGNLLSYLGRTAEMRPSFVRRVAENVDTEEVRTLRFLISVGRDLPADDAAAIGRQVSAWIQGEEAYAYLAGQTLRLAEYLAEHSEYDVVLEIIEVITRPRDFRQLEMDQGMVRYNLTTMLNDNFDDLIDERGEEFIDVIASNLNAVLRRKGDADGGYGMVAERTSIADLNFVDNDRGNLDEILLEYYVRAVSTWIAEDPSNASRRTFIEELLSEPSVYRRVGLFILSKYPGSFDDLVQEELTAEDNYRDRQANYEFYLTLDDGFEYLDNSEQEQVCEIIAEGPLTEEVEDRAAWLAKQGEESASYFEQRIREKWRRDRLYLIQNHLEEEYADILDALVEKYGEPDQLPSRTPRPVVRGGFVHERGPEETEELREQSAAEVLSTAVEWEPPESEGWDTGEDDQLEEQNYIGFSRQLRELIKEDPQRYAREISVLEDANPRYAEAAFRAFKDLVDDGETFPWSSILELGRSITASPTEWSSRSRTNLAVLINRGIATDETDFPDGVETQVEGILLTLITDPDPDTDRDQPPEGMAGHGDPVQVAVNAVRPMALNAYITYLGWKDEQTEGQLDQDVFEPIQDRIREDPSLAVRSVIGRRFGALYGLNAKLVDDHLEVIFPRDTDQTARRRFVTAWNSFTAGNRYWDNEEFRSYYHHALSLIETGEDVAYQIAIRSTTVHVASIYLFEDEDISDEDSVIRRFYAVADEDDVKELASTMSSSIGNDNVEERWDKIRDLWKWRLDTLESDEDENPAEIREFLDCVRESRATTLEREKTLIIRSLPMVVQHAFHWRRLEEWFAEQSSSNPVVAINLFEELVDVVPCDEWSSIARNSQEDYRSSLYENAEAAGKSPLQTALDIADQFAAENNQMDREFLERNLTVQ